MNTIKRIGALVLVIVMICSLTGCNSSDYKKAEELLETGNYKEALSIYESLESGGSYKDSAEKVLECKYQIAGVAYNNMDYIQAYDIYCELNDYKDSVENSLKAGYALANQYAANDNFILAYTTFDKLGNYKQSQELAKKCASSMMDNASIGDTVFFGAYEQDGNEENGLEPIEWIVLAKNGDHTLLLSEYILEERKFDGHSYHWEDSDLREWLNTDFYENAFNTEDQANIQLMLTSENTSDKIFCLSAEEARGFFGSDDSRRACPTAALLSNGFKAWENCGEWWTRSVSTASNGKGVVPVEADGNVRSAGTVPYHRRNAYTDIGVRPAICIKSSETTATAQNMSLFGYDSNTDLDNEPNLWGSGSHNGSGGSGGKCIVCNGTGYVKYYYGSSDLEAWLSGHDAYTVGTCPSCGGTGKD
ncbi:MAG: DUF6273 domain-containing protein [Lachnospiraceae bacterium]|nr:DUF6273 domain-containing protein [Lachnospiraceae bacterium]